MSRSGPMLSRRHFVRGSLATAVAASLPARSFAAILGPTPKVDSDLDAITGAGKPVTLTRAMVQELGDSLRGNLLLPGHAAYEDARRVINAQMNKHPALIVQPRGAADVKQAVDFARANSLLVAVKCGGHSPSGKSTCDKGMMIDLSLMRSVRVDPKTKIARVAGGSGLALDNVVSVDMVTAKGEIVRASADENPELFWGTRGGGGNFGVVTSFEFALHPMQREVVGGIIMFPLKDAKSVLSFYSDYEGMAPDELYLSGVIVSNPKKMSGVGFQTCYSGSKSEAEKIYAKIRSLGKPIADGVKPIDYVALQRSGDSEDPRAIGSYTKTGYVKHISPALIDAMINGLEEHPDRSTTVGFQHCGGQISRVAKDATAFPHREIHATSLLLVDWPVQIDPTQHIAWLKKYWATIEPHTDGFYTNDVVDETQKQVDENYLGNYRRLLKLKNQYDPTNL